MDQNTQNEENLWDFLYKIWDDAENREKVVNTYYDYWDGKYTATVNSFFKDQTKTSDNIINEIVEGKLASMLDAQYSLAVKPIANVFADLTKIQDQAALADVYNNEMINVLEDNKFSSLKEIIGRNGLIGGVGAVQATWEMEDVDGKIKIVSIDPKMLRWDKNSERCEDLTFFAYRIDISPSIAKRKYAKQHDGTFDENMVRRVDRLANIKSDMTKGEKGGVVSVQSGETANLAYSYSASTITAGKVVSLIVMFLLDDSLYAPVTDESKEENKIKQKAQYKYPDGRMIVFSMNQKEKIIFDDRAMPKGFKNLGNIDLFTPTRSQGIAGKGEVEDIIPIQDRINGTLLKARTLIADHISTIVANKDLFQDIADGDWVQNAVTWFEGKMAEGNMPFALDNGAITHALALYEVVKQLKTKAKENARVNDTMLYGTMQKGTTSADQIEVAQESPMASIRSIQRPFKGMIVSVGEKIISLIQEYYTMQRLIKITTGIDKAEFAKFNQDAEKQKSVDLLDKAGKIIKHIKIDPKWKFKVEVIAGTEIPRSRRENAVLTKELYGDGTLGDTDDIDVKEQYLKSQDFPNYRAFVSHMRKKAEEPIPPLNIKDILPNKDLARAFADIMKSLEFNHTAKGQVLESVGLSPLVDRLDTAPVQATSSKADTKDIVAITPGIISNDPKVDNEGRVISAAIIDKENKDKEVSVNE